MYGNKRIMSSPERARLSKKIWKPGLLSWRELRRKRGSRGKRRFVKPNPQVSAFSLVHHGVAIGSNWLSDLGLFGECFESEKVKQDERK